ncbi:hypothetical protein [Gemmatimonas sp.]|uniref:hypothetical protein n=1 Tax=Gemmatimonas sp. TaxID=1962908 RepID=UPI00391B1C57
MRYTPSHCARSLEQRLRFCDLLSRLQRLVEAIAHPERLGPVEQRARIAETADAQHVVLERA